MYQHHSNIFVSKAAQYIFLIAALLFFLSFLETSIYKPWKAFYASYIAFLALFIFFLGVTLVVKQFIVDVRAVMLVLVSIIPFIQLQFGIIFFSGEAFIHFAYILGASLALLCGVSLVYKGYQVATLKLLCLTFLAVGFVNTFLGLYQYLDLNYLDGLVIRAGYAKRAYGNLAQPNNYSTLMILSVLSAWYLFEKQQYSKWVYILILSFLVGAIAVAQSRTSILVFFAVLVAFFYYFYRVKISFSSKFFYILYVAAFYYVWLFILETIVGAGSRELLEAKISPRFIIWQEMLMVIADGPLWGYGWGQVGVAQVLLTDSPFEKSLYVNYSHNVILDILIWNGPIVGSLIIFWVVFWLWKIVFYCRSVEDFIMIMMVVAIGIHGMLEFPLSYAYFLLPTFLILGLINFPSLTRFNVNFIVAAKYSVVVLIICFSLMITVFKEYSVIKQERLGIALSILSEQDHEPSKNLKEIFLLTQLREYLYFLMIPLDTDADKKDMSKEQLLWLKQVSHRYPSAGGLNIYASACRSHGCENEAIRVEAAVSRLFEKNNK